MVHQFGRRACPDFGRGCQLLDRFLDDRLIGTLPLKRKPVNQVKSSVNGRVGREFVYRPDGLAISLIRRREIEDAYWKKVHEPQNFRSYGIEAERRGDTLFFGRRLEA